MKTPVAHPSNILINTQLIPHNLPPRRAFIRREDAKARVHAELRALFVDRRISPRRDAFPEMRSRVTLFTKVESKRAQGVADAIVDLLAPYREQTHTITFDNGKEFADHEQIADALEADIYFAHPYASWERGTNENTNGLLCQYFPKSSDFSDATETKVAWVHERLNTRPRKCLEFQMPETVFRESVGTCT